MSEKPPVYSGRDKLLGGLKERMIDAANGEKHMAAGNIDRRSLLARTLLGMGRRFADQASAEVAPALKVIFGFGRGSSSARVLSLLESGLTRELGGRVEKIHMVGDQGRR